jgi:protein ATS1
MLLLQALGSNGSGQLGLGHKDDVSSPEPVLLPPSLANSTSPTTPKVCRIAAGGNHTLLLLSSGDLLWSGDHTTGACGQVTAADTAELRPEFRPVDLSVLPEGSNVRHVAATWAASVVVASSGGNGADVVYSFGSGEKGELGLGQGTFRASTPTQIPNFPPPGTQVVDISGCMGHVVAVLSNGEAWGWGNGRKGQLGDPLSGTVHTPRRIEAVGFRAVKAVCGREFTCLIGPAETGEIVVLGSDKWGVRSGAPGNVTGWKEVGAGWGSVFVLKGDGTLLSWGRDDHGQLAREDLARVRHIAVGSEHALALTETGDLMVWGWGEHGNCGPIREDNGEKGQRNRIISSEQGTKITVIGAGCATSWFAIEKPT